MDRRPFGRAHRVQGAPTGVVAWIDHETRDGLLLLNAACFTVRQEQAITEALREGRFTALQVLIALTTREG